MKILVKAKPGSKAARVEKLDGPLMPHYLVAVKEPAAEGRANRAIEKALAEHLGVAQSRVRIVRGHSSKDKIVEVG